MNYKNYNDYELIYHIQENDEESRNIMFDKYQPIIRKIAGNYYQKFSMYGYQYEDFVQEGMLAFYKALSSYDEQKDSLFYTFSTVCIERGLTTFCRRISNDKKNISREYFEDIDDCSVVDERSDIQKLFQDQEKEQVVKDFIYDLSLEISSIMELKWNGFTYREIGILLDIPSSSAEYKTRRARFQLFMKLKKI